MRSLVSQSWRWKIASCSHSSSSAHSTKCSFRRDWVAILVSTRPPSRHSWAIHTRPSIHCSRWWALGAHRAVAGRTCVSRPNARISCRVQWRSVIGASSSSTNHTSIGITIVLARVRPLHFICSVLWHFLSIGSGASAHWRRALGLCESVVVCFIRH